MDSAMRDLEQIREHTGPDDRRALGSVGILVGITTAMIFALGTFARGWDGDSTPELDDPLARLDRAAGLAAEAAPETEEDIEIDRQTLMFPETLRENTVNQVADERPEVAISLASAAAELAHLDPVHAATDQQVPAPDPLRARIPAAFTTATTAHLQAAPRARDTLLNTAVQGTPPSAAPATAGQDGPYTIQVISYNSAESAHAFASGLQSRGHAAFVMQAEIENRGTVWRVRIGPFETRGEAQRYRDRFEENESMNTYVVRRRERNTG